MQAGEKLIITVIGTTAPPGLPTLPKDDISDWENRQRHTRTYRLVAYDWGRIVNHFPAGTPERRLMELFQMRNNGPLHRSEIQEILGSELKPNVTTRISQSLLKKLARPRGESWPVYFFHQLKPPLVEVLHYYSISKSFMEYR